MYYCIYSQKYHGWLKSGHQFGNNPSDYGRLEEAWQCYDPTAWLNSVHSKRGDDILVRMPQPGLVGWYAVIGENTQTICKRGEVEKFLLTGYEEVYELVTGRKLKITRKFEVQW